MTFDNVRCCNCSFFGLVPMGAEECPECHKEGVLTWAETQEVEA